MKKIILILLSFLSLNILSQPVLTVRQGGTGISTYTIGDIIYSNGTHSLTRLPIGSSGYILTSIGGVPTWTTNAGGVQYANSPLYITSNTVSIYASTTPTATYVAQWDANKNLFANNFIPTITTTTASGSTITMNPNSSRLQILTGTTTATYKLPSASTFTTGAQFEFNNNSTGTLSIIDATNGAVTSVVPGGKIILTCTDASSPAGVWDWHGLIGQTANWGTSYVTTDGASLAINTGSVAPAVKLQTVETGTTNTRGVFFDQYSSTTNSSKITARKARGTFTSPTVVQNADVLANFTGEGYDGANFQQAGTVRIIAAATPTAGIVPGKLDLQTANTSGTLVSALSVDQSQQVTITNTVTAAAFTTSGGTTSQVVSGTGSLLSTTGTNSVVLSTGATLTTPTLGVASATSLAITGTAGNGFISLTTQTASPSAPSSGSVIFSNSNNKLSWRGSANNYVKTFDGGLATADRVYSLPNRNVMVDSITTSTSTALNGILQGNGSVVSSVATVGTGSVVLSGVTTLSSLTTSSGGTIMTTTLTQNVQNKTFDTTNVYSISSIDGLKWHGQWYAPPISTVPSSVTGQTGQMMTMPFLIGIDHYVNYMGIYITTGVASTGKVRLALYADDGTGKPGNLIEDSGDLAATSNATFVSYKLTTHTQLLAKNKLVWVGVQVNSNSIAIPFSSGLALYNFNPGQGANSALTGSMYNKTQSYGAAPSPFGSGTQVNPVSWGTVPQLKME